MPGVCLAGVCLGDSGECKEQHRYELYRTGDQQNYQVRKLGNRSEAERR